MVENDQELEYCCCGLKAQHFIIFREIFVSTRSCYWIDNNTPPEYNETSINLLISNIKKFSNSL